MTIQEFDNTRFCAGMRVEYRGKEYVIMSVDFQERTIGIVWDEIENDETFDVDYEIRWVRCENCKLLDI